MPGYVRGGRCWREEHPQERDLYICCATHTTLARQSTLPLLPHRKNMRQQGPGDLRPDVSCGHTKPGLASKTDVVHRMQHNCLLRKHLVCLDPPPHRPLSAEFIYNDPREVLQHDGAFICGSWNKFMA